MYKRMFFFMLLIGSSIGAAQAQNGTVKVFTPEKFKQRLAADKQVVLLDVRTDQEVREGMIPGAVQLDVLSPDFKRKAARLDKNKTYLVYCKSGIRSGRATDTMKEMGFKNLINLEGGITAWKKKGYPVDKGKH